jgi:hypothetical protein
MKPELQRIRIAETCGFNKRQWLELKGGIVFGTSGSLPDYLNDLNAMHEAWSSVVRPRHSLMHAFENTLREIIERDAKEPSRDYFPAMVTNAAAAQRAEAFLRTLNLWEE